MTNIIQITVTLVIMAMMAAYSVNSLFNDVNHVQSLRSLDLIIVATKQHRANYCQSLPKNPTPIATLMSLKILDSDVKLNLAAVNVLYVDNGQALLELNASNAKQQALLSYIDQSQNYETYYARPNNQLIVLVRDNDATYMDDFKWRYKVTNCKTV